MLRPFPGKAAKKERVEMILQSDIGWFKREQHDE